MPELVGQCMEKYKSLYYRFDMVVKTDQRLRIARLALNFKGIPYKTEWIPYIRLQNTLKSFGIKPNPPGSWSEYSVPTVRFRNSMYVMDSAAIAAELEARYPNPSLRLDRELEKEAEGAMGEVFMSLIPYLMPMATNLVASEDLEWFKADRAKRFGMTIEEAFESRKDAAPYFEAARPGFEKCVKILQAHKLDEGPFILGREPCYADFYFAATMQMVKRAGGQWSEKFFNEAPSEMRELHEACQQWADKQD